MNLFSSLFGNSEEEKSSKVGWRMLIDLGQLNEIVELSHQQPVLLFKHSTRCSISRFALKNFENEYDFEENKVKSYYLDLLEYRNISNEVATRFDVIHQSPQILLFYEGKCVYHNSHEGILINNIKKIINSLV
ncbi:bacillithiol system redox-active protein YtxJ [Flavobacterium piscinae]|uniref:Bacillithiol system redox-active protein YtxJ n=1 Tax=Flavobacterium piscinae TaxID=2506424 RepID=A0A4V1N4H9_9FLAO|nr:bacillithiol system redox-active protein YtxJ [Flavobacterium piscinae]RXR32226.1 bacillithiol system redox-active protein YtxJ [Flavobacterium piscinae]